MTCEYCDQPGIPRTPESGTLVCDGCWKLLKDPKTALPFLRGHLSMKLKGTIPQKNLDDILNKYMGIISEWEPRN